MDCLPHPFSGARPSTHRTTSLYRRSRSRAIRPTRRLPRRVLRRHQAHHLSSPLRRHLRASRIPAPAQGSARRPHATRTSHCPTTSPHCHRLRPVQIFEKPGDFPNSVPLTLMGHNVWYFTLDRHNIREYVKHPRALFADLHNFKEATTENMEKQMVRGWKQATSLGLAQPDIPSTSTLLDSAL